MIEIHPSGFDLLKFDFEIFEIFFTGKLKSNSVVATFSFFWWLPHAKIFFKLKKRLEVIKDLQSYQILMKCEKVEQGEAIRIA